MASALPALVEWRIYNVPVGARIDRGYAHDDTADCSLTNQNLRTQNDRLRFDRDLLSPTTVIVRYDSDTAECGHVQVDISIDGVNVLGEVVNYGQDCTPPVCEPFPSFDYIYPQMWFNQQGLMVGISVDAQHESQTGTWLILLFENTTPPYNRFTIKAAWPLVSPCGATRELHEYWATDDWGAHQPANGGIYFVGVSDTPNVTSRSQLQRLQQVLP